MILLKSTVSLQSFLSKKLVTSKNFQRNIRLVINLILILYVFKGVKIEFQTKYHVLSFLLNRGANRIWPKQTYTSHETKIKIIPVKRDENSNVVRIKKARRIAKENKAVLKFHHRFDMTQI